MGGYALPPSLGMFSIQASPTKWNTPMICQWFANEWFPAESFWMLEFPQSIFETRQHGQFPFLLVFQSWLVPMFTLDHHAGRLLWTLSLNGYNYATNTWIGLWGPCGPLWAYGEISASWNCSPSSGHAMSYSSTSQTIPIDQHSHRRSDSSGVMAWGPAPETRAIFPIPSGYLALI